MKEEEPTEKNEKGVFNTEISEEMRKAYLDYAMSVIVSRAIPSVEDGLKPVQRRILYAMHQMGLKPGSQTKKSARIVGDTMGKFHPHGDMAIYDALVRMTQDFSLRYPLVYGQGNWGSIDGDPPAAMRYSEARLMQISTELLEDIEKETVKFVPNYDNSTKEPELLPGKLPNLLLNGASGIAVGMATNIPPHNITELCDAIVLCIKNPNSSIEELAQIVKGPDFPTGGSISGDMLELYKTGKGRIIMRGRTTTEELKKGANSKFILNAIYKYTRLQDSFNANMLALHDSQPKVMNLKQILDAYIEYRKKVITNRTKFDLKKAKERQEIVEGLLIALKHIDNIITLIKKSHTATEALEGLMKKFSLGKRQAQAVLDTKLQQLTSLEQEKLKKESSELKITISELEKILGDIKEVLSIIVKEVNEIKRKYGDNRRTQILQRVSEISEKDLVQDKEVVVTITDKGYCKRMDLKTYKEQKRGGRGVIGSNLAMGDFVKKLITCSTHDYLMFFTSRGKLYWLKAYEIPEAERYSKGKAIINLLNLRDESITNVISVKKFDEGLFMATKKGIVKKIPLENFSKPRSSGVKAINLPDDNSDVLIGVELLKKGQEILLATKKGQAIRFNESEVRDTGRNSYGVTGIKLDKDDEVVSLEVLETQAVLTITKNGYGKRTAVEDYRKTARAGKGVINLKTSDKTGDVVTTVSVNDSDNIIVTTAKGIVMRTSLDNIRVMGRATQGVHIVKLQQGDYVTDLVKVLEAEVIGGNGE